MFNLRLVIRETFSVTFRCNGLIPLVRNYGCLSSIHRYNQIGVNSINYRQHSCQQDLQVSSKSVVLHPFNSFKLLRKMSSSFVFPKNQPVVSLDCQKAFQELDEKEKCYSHYLSQAAFYGSLIVLIQTSPESPVIFQVLHKLYASQPMKDLKRLAIEECNFTEDEFNALLIYSSGFFCNMGNYKGFGDTKFVPDFPKEKLYSLLKLANCYKNNEKLMEELWKNCGNEIYSLKSREKQLGLGQKGVTTYFSTNCSEEDANIVNKFLKNKNIDAYNNRAFKTVGDDGKVEYEIRFASVLSNDDKAKNLPLGSHCFDGINFKVTRGDYSGILSIVAENLCKAKEYASNETEKKMLDCYAESFSTGSLDAHKDGSRYWIKNKSPIIETYIGFIETYRDPVGMRGEFEGFVAIVNKPMSKKFSELVDNAENLLTLLPWPEAYEKDKFLRPDFTSLDVLSFAGSGIPAGINIPNYDEIRQNEGFKNVSLGNVIPASYKDSVLPFLNQSDRELMIKHRIGSFEVQVGLHELLGHGSGKLFYKKKDGKFNFDQQSVKNLVTGESIDKYYEEGENYDSKFTNLGSAYEECRAECVGLHLCILPKVLEIFGYGNDEEGFDVAYVNWLSMVWKGLLSLEMYQEDANVWLQAHSQARFVILNVLLEAGQDFTNVKLIVDEDGKNTLLVSMDRNKIKSVGRQAIADFLNKLQTYKSCGDDESGRKLFAKYSSVNDNGKIPFATYRKIVMENKQPRKMFVQANTTFKDGRVELHNYESSHEGLIQSWVDRFSSTDIHSILKQLWSKDRNHF